MTRIQHFSHLRDILTDRMLAGGEEMEEDVDACLAFARPRWKKQRWCDALFNPFIEWSEREATIDETDPRIVAWVQALAAQTGISGPCAQRLALMCSRDFQAQISRGHCSASFTRTAFNSQVVRFYYLERCNVILLKSQLLTLCGQDSTLSIKPKLVQERDAIVDILAGVKKINLSPVESASRAHSDCYAAERAHQHCFEMCLLLQHLYCMTHYVRTPRAAVISEMKSLLVASENGVHTVFDFYMKSRQMLTDAVSANYFRLVFVSWVCQSLITIGPLAGGDTLQDTLGEAVYKRLVSLEGVEGALVSLLMYSIEGRQLGHHQRVSQGMVSLGLTFLLYILTGRYTPPPDSVLATAGKTGNDVQTTSTGPQLIAGVNMVDVFASMHTTRDAAAITSSPGAQTFSPESYTDVDERARLSFLQEPNAVLARTLLSHIHDGVFPRKSEVQLLLLTRIALASRHEKATSAGPLTMTDDGSEGGDMDFNHGLADDALLRELVKNAGWLFPSCVATTALLEIARATRPDSHDDWWAVLCNRSTVLQPYTPPEDTQNAQCTDTSSPGTYVDETQLSMAEMPEESKWIGSFQMPRDGDFCVRVPDVLGNWFTPLAPVPSSMQVAKAAEEVALQAFPEGSQVFGLWQLPEDKVMNGWLWMCMRVVYIFKIGRRTEPQAEKWLVPYLELVNAVIPLFHVMLCGHDPNPIEELTYFCSKGFLRLQELESYLRDLQAPLVGGNRQADGGRFMQSYAWTLPLIVSEVLASLVEWQEARCYQQRSSLITSCATLLTSLLRISRRSEGGALNVADNVMSSARCLFLPGRQTSRSPLLHLFWVVEAANKRCTSTRGIMALLSSLVSHPDDYVHLRDDLHVITNYICEVFTDIGNQFSSHASEEKWECACFALQALVDIINQTQLPRGACRPGAGAQEAAVLAHLVHSNRMGRALTDMMARAASSLYEVDKFERGLPADLANRVLFLTLQTAELGLIACEQECLNGKPAPALAQLLSEAEPSASFSKFGDKFTLPSLLFYVVAFGAEDTTRIQAAKTFSLLCSVSGRGSLLRHVGYRAASTGEAILTSIANCKYDLNQEVLRDPETKQAYRHGLLHPGVSTEQMPAIFGSRDELRDAWLDAAQSTCRVLSLLHMMAAMVAHQPQLFVQAFFDKAEPMVDPIGTLLQTFVVNGEEWETLPPPAVKEATLNLVVAALECREPCRSLVLARTIPTLSMKISATCPAIGDVLAGEERRGCPWDRMPMIVDEDLKDFKESLDRSVGEDGVPCLIFDPSRSWPQCGFKRRSADIVSGAMSFVVGPMTAHPAVSHRETILQHGAEVAKKAFERAGFKKVHVTASWALEKPVEDPGFWPILAESLAASRQQIGQFMVNAGEAVSKTEKASGMSWWILMAGHVLRSMGVVASLTTLYPPQKFTSPHIDGYETAMLVKAARGCLGRVLGKWGDCDVNSPTSGVLGMLSPCELETDSMAGDGLIHLDGLLGQAAGLFYGSVKVPQLPVPRVMDAPRKRMLASAKPPSPSPRKVGLTGDGSPKMVSPLIRPVHTNTPNNNCVDTPVSLFPATPMMLEVFPSAMASLAPDPLHEELAAEKVTLYELLRKAEAAVHTALSDNGVAEELNAGVMPNPSQAALATLRSAFGVSGDTPPAARKQMPGAFICMDTLKAAYPKCGVMLRMCQELNDVVGLAAAAHYMLTSVSSVVTILLKSACPFHPETDPHMLLPTQALLNPSDWRHGGRSSLVFVLLQKCLLHPPHEAADGDGTDPTPLVPLLDLHIRAEASRLLTAMIAEVSRRSDLVREGRLSTSERPFASTQDRHTVSRHLVWQVYDVLQALHATNEDNTLGIEHSNRKGKARPGEADLLVSLCLLGKPEGRFKAAATGDSATLASAVFPHLHQYLSMEDLSSASQADLECYKAAFVALSTFGVPEGRERHAVQLAKTFVAQLQSLHRMLCEHLSQPHLSRVKIQEVVERGQLILQGLQRMATCNSGCAVLEEAGVVPFLSTLHLFLPPANDAVSLADRHNEKTSEVMPAWCTLWQGILDTVTAVATPPPVDGARKLPSAAVAAQLHAFVENVGPRLEYLLSEQGLQQSCNTESVHMLQLVSAVVRCTMASGKVLTAVKPAFSWLLPVLTASLPNLKGRFQLRTPHTRNTGFPQTLSLKEREQMGEEEKKALTAGDMVRVSGASEMVSQVCSIVRLHLVAFLPLSAPVGALGRASPAVARLLEAITLAESKRDVFTNRLNELCEAASGAPERTVIKIVKEHGYPFTAATTPAQMRELREAIVDECVAFWANSAAATTRPLFTLNANAANAPLEFEEMAVFGKEDELSSPAKAILELVDSLTECVAELLASSPEGLRVHKGAKLSTAVKQAASALEQCAVLREVYMAGLELAAPTETQTLWAGNVLQRLLNERSSMQLSSIPGSVMRKRLYTPLNHLIQSGNTEEVSRAKSALALHCLCELRRQPESPWLSRPCKSLHTATVSATARDNAQAKRMIARVKSTISLLRTLTKERHGSDIELE